MIGTMAFAINYCCSAGFVFNLFSILESHGLTEAEAVSYFIPRSIAWSMSSPFVGLCADKINPKYIAGIGLMF